MDDASAPELSPPPRSPRRAYGARRARPCDCVKNGDGAGIRRLAHLVLRNQRDDRGTRHLSASRDKVGRIRIDGHDLGRGVEDAFGAGLSEYEWSWVIEPDVVPAAVAALDGREGDDPLRVLEAWSIAHGGADPGSHLRDARVPIAFWNRIGD
jgi:hypothetical protein